MKKKNYIKPNAEIVRLSLKGSMLYEGPNNYNGGGMTMLQDSKTHKPTSVGNTSTAGENTEDDEVGAKSFNMWDVGKHNGWGD